MEEEFARPQTRALKAQLKAQSQQNVIDNQPPSHAPLPSNLNGFPAQPIVHVPSGADHPVYQSLTQQQGTLQQKQPPPHYQHLQQQQSPRQQHKQPAPQPTKQPAPHPVPPHQQLVDQQQNRQQQQQQQPHPQHQQPRQQQPRPEQQQPRPEQQQPRPEQQQPRPEQQQPRPQQTQPRPQPPQPHSQQQQSLPQQTQPRPQQQQPRPQNKYHQQQHPNQHKQQQQQQQTSEQRQQYDMRPNMSRDPVYRNSPQIVGHLATTTDLPHPGKHGHERPTQHHNVSAQPQHGHINPTFEHDTVDTKPNTQKHKITGSNHGAQQHGNTRTTNEPMAPSYHGSVSHIPGAEATIRPSYHGSSQQINGPNQSSYHGGHGGYHNTTQRPQDNHPSTSRGVQPSQNIQELNVNSFQKEQPVNKPGQNSQAEHKRGRYEKRASGVPSGGHAVPPRNTKRGRIMSQHDNSPQQLNGQAHKPQFQPPPQQANPGTNPLAAPTQPVRATSLKDIHAQIELTPNPQTGGKVSGINESNLYRPKSVPNISSTLPTNTASRQGSFAFNQNVDTTNKLGLWRSKSVVELAFTGDGTNARDLQRWQSLTCLIATNPRLARTASMYALYEKQVASNTLPDEFYQTRAVAIAAAVLFFPFGIPLLYFALDNDENWITDIPKAVRVNHMVFWGSVVSIAIGALFILTLIITLPLAL